MSRFPALPPVLMLCALAACSTVAADAPPLLSTGEIAARIDGAADPSRGVQVAAALGGRASGLQARAAALRRAGISSAERRALMLRAEELTQAQN